VKAAFIRAAINRGSASALAKKQRLILRTERTLLEDVLAIADEVIE